MRYLLLLLITVFTWSARSQQNINIQVQSGHTLPVTCIAYHPTKPMIASGSQDHSVIFWSAINNRQLNSINISNSSITDIVFNKSGSLLMITNKSNEIIIFDLDKNQVRYKRKFDFSNAYLFDAHFNSNDHIISIESNRDDLAFWDYEKDVIIYSRKNFSSTSSNLAINNSRQFFSFKNANSFDVIKSPELDTISFEFDKANNYQFNPLGTQIAVGSSKLFAEIFDLDSKKRTFHLEPDPDVQCDGCNLKVFWSPDGNQISTYDHKNGLYIWSPTSGKLISKLKLEERLEYYFYTSTGKYIVLSNDSELWIVDSKSGKLVLQQENKYLNNFQPIINPEETSYFLPADNFTIREYSINNGRPTDSYSGINNQPSNQLPYDYLDWYQSGSLNYYKRLMPMELTNSKDRLIIGKIGLEVIQVDLKTGFIKSLYNSDKTTTSIAISKNDSLLVSGDASGVITFYDLVSKKVLFKKKIHNEMIFDLSFNQNGTNVISTSRDGRIYETELSTMRSSFISESDQSTMQLEHIKNDLYYLTGCLDHTINLFETDSKLRVRQLLGHTEVVSDVAFNEKTGEVYSSSWDGSVRIWDLGTGLLEGKFFLEDHAAALCVLKHPSKEILYVGGVDKKLYCYDLENRKILFSKIVHESGIAKIKIADNKIIIRGLDGTIKIFNDDLNEESLSLFIYPDNEWLALDQKRMKFEGTKNAMKQIHLVKDQTSMEIGSFFNQYFVPGLLKAVLSNQVENENRGSNFEQLIRNDIQYTISLIRPGERAIVTRSDTVYRQGHGTTTLSIDFGNNLKYKDLMIYNNGKLILNESSSDEVAFRGSKNNVQVDVNLVPENNQIEVKIIDQNLVEHLNAPIEIFFDTVAGKMDLFILSLGINEYENRDYNLRYAKNDADSFSSTIESSAKSIFSSVNLYTLKDKKVTKKNVLDLVEQINQNIGPEDVFVFYYAGHGILLQHDESNDFYLVMSDVVDLYGGTQAISEKGISADELMFISKRIKAHKQVFFLDACQSGGALSAFATRGVTKDKTIAQLARNSGTYFITASQDIEYANESSSLEHGLFTYAILEILSGKAANFNDKIVTMSDLKSYIEERVPELSKTYKTSPQYPTGFSFGNDFPIGVLNPK